MSIPKIIHQIWIGPKQIPSKMIQTWKDKHPEPNFRHILWTEREIQKRKEEDGLVISLEEQINATHEYFAKADLLRLDILYHYGGIYMDADSICIEPIDYLVENKKAFLVYENEHVRGKGWSRGHDYYKIVLADTHPLIVNGIMGFPPKHPFIREMIDWIKSSYHPNQWMQYHIHRPTRLPYKPWMLIGPGLITRTYFTYPPEKIQKDDITILPSHTFLPIHLTGHTYHGHDKVYAYQEWGSSKDNYDKLNDIELPSILKPVPSYELYSSIYPNFKPNAVSVLVSSYNTNFKYITECLQSIREQQGHFNIELVWINDGSNEFNTILLRRALERFEKETRFTRVKYIEHQENKGIGYTLREGILECSHELIIKMDSDDIMVPERIQFQLDYMWSHPHIKISGGQMVMFQQEFKEPLQVVNKTNHPSYTRESYRMRNNPHWIMNHPTVCYLKSAVLEVGNYNDGLSCVAEDFDLEMRMLMKFGEIHNVDKMLVYYRLHPNQITRQTLTNNQEHWKQKRNEIIENAMNLYWK
jgi:GT2 family glycosyltransferase